jgi:hypothetical protein
MGIIAARRYFLNATKAYRDRGTPAPDADDAAAFRIRPVEGVMSPDADWLAELMPAARPLPAAVAINT